ncbi:F-box/LRR-repeat protein 15 isoform 2-T2 [Molossus nigricans]|uniref:F-box/LRR-repeat protein 15 n=1 Tax=Molossus molossus TaxID=27622 RepID=A0A7J8DPG9_MOLMO|nr:F-box/LRR-repeat protein 15 [Molossus molossus]KAF6424899.1 F-box and leucine rich repeat protein 15 [Molossus molossus]
MEPSGGEQEPGAVRLLDLPWEDVLLPHVLSRVPLCQLLRLQRVSRAFRALVQLHLAGLRSFDAAQVGPQIPRAALAWLLRDAERLKELALAPCHEWLSDEDLVPVLARNPQLRSVALAGCGQLSRRTLGALAEGCPRLQRLSLAHCDWVDGLALRGLADRCPALEELDLTACRQLKDEAIVYLVQRRGAGLRSISLAVNANVGDAAVQELARNCPELEHLDLTGCLRVGSDGVRTLAEYCPALRSLRVRHCHHVAEPSLSRLRKRGVDIDVEPPLHQALVLLQDMAGFAPFVNLQV